MCGDCYQGGDKKTTTESTEEQDYRVDGLPFISEFGCLDIMLLPWQTPTCRRSTYTLVHHDYLQPSTRPLISVRETARIRVPLMRKYVLLAQLRPQSVPHVRPRKRVFATFVLVADTGRQSLQCCGSDHSCVFARPTFTRLWIRCAPQQLGGCAGEVNVRRHQQVRLCLASISTIVSLYCRIKGRSL